MTLPDALVAEVIHSIPLVETVASMVKLRKVGVEYVGLCPFHEEKSPSFTVSPNKGFWHCFGCGKHGDALDFIQETEGLTFREALQQAADAAGISLENADKRSGDALGPLYAANQLIHNRYQAMLGDAPEEVWDYLDERRYSVSQTHDLQLGYSFGDRLVFDGIDARILKALGFPLQGNDPFAGRLIWPIRDRLGRIHGFGGRIIESGVPKYLNSRDSEVYRKKEMLYGVPTARKLATKAPLLIVEGYTDVDALQFRGIPAVACCGTALSSQQVRSAFQISEEIILCFDGDKAGRAATRKAIETVLPEVIASRSVKIMSLPEGSDPHALVTDSPDLFKKQMSAARWISDALIYPRGLSPEQQSAHYHWVIGMVVALPARPFRTSLIQGLRHIGIEDQRFNGLIKPRSRPVKVQPPKSTLEVFLSTAFNAPADALKFCLSTGGTGVQWVDRLLHDVSSGTPAAAAIRNLPEPEKETASRLIAHPSPHDPSGLAVKRLHIKMKMERAMDAQDFIAAKKARDEMERLDRGE